MSIIIIGAGEVGYNVARRLSREMQDIVVIDKDEEKIKRVSETLDVQAIHGSGSSMSVLRKAGIEQAEIVVAATDSDEVNMVSCLVAGAQAIVPVKIARIKDSEYATNEHILGEDRLNIDDTDAPDLHAVAQQLVSRAHQYVLGAAPQGDDIIGYQAMPALHQIERGFTLADGAAPREQQAHAIDVDQGTMNRG